jgi:protease secretion system outer membrane protein
MIAISNHGATRYRRFAIAALLALGAGHASAVSLNQAYEAALKNDPQYRMNYYENEAAKENAVLGRSFLLPQVSANYRANRNIADTNTCCNLAGDRVLEHPRYISRSSAVQVQQPILNLDGYYRYRQGKVQSAQGAKKFESDTNDVIIRVVGAYADALFAEDQVELSKVQRDMYVEQMKVNNRLFEKGEGTKTDMLETQARMDLAEAQLVEAQNNAIAMRNTLAGVIGMDPGGLDKLGPDFRFQDLPLKSFDEWLATAQERNPLLAAGRLAIENARLQVKRDKAGHYPRVDLVAAYSRDDAASLTNYRQDSINRTVGVQVNIPIYQGGAISATTRQSAANLERSRAELDNQSSRILVELRKSYDLVQNSVAKINALERAVASSKELMTATEKSIAGGVRINLDLLNVQQQLYTSQRDLAQARYSYLLGLLRLRADAGTLDAGAVREVAAYFR